MNTISNTTTMSTTTAPTIKSITGEHCTLQLARFINPLNENEVIIHYKDFALVVNKRLWNLLSVNAKVQRIESFEEFKNSLDN